MFSANENTVAGPTDVELAWVAGCFEGEGSVGIRKPKSKGYCTLAVSVGNTDIQMLDLLLKFWPVGLKHKKAGENKNAAWAWVLYSKRAAAFLVAVRPFLRTDRVKAKTGLALEFQDSKRHGGFKNALFLAAYKEKQLEFYDRMRVLNLRGSKALRHPSNNQ